MRHLRNVGIIGAGPAGLYCAKKLLAVFPNVKINFFERHNQPFGLLRYGVAPDHVDMKQAIVSLQKSVLDNPRVSIEFGRKVDKNDLKLIRDRFEAVVIATGAPEPVDSARPFLKFENCFSGLEMAEWYNGFGHKNIRFDERIKEIVILGMGDVAMDVSRLLTKNGDDFKQIPSVNQELRDDLKFVFFSGEFENAHKLLHRRFNPTLTIIGRQSLPGSAFSVKQLRQLLEIKDICVSATNLIPLSESETKIRRNLRCYTLLEKAIIGGRGFKKLNFLFFHTPISLESDSDGRVKSVICRDEKMGDELVAVRADMCITCFGQKKIAIFDEIDWPGLYFVGWASRGSKGLLADVVVDAERVVQAISKDLRDSDF